MLNISRNNVSKYVDLSKYKSTEIIFNKDYRNNFKYTLFVFSVLLLIIVFLPWTQTISSKGKVTTLKPNQRPQTIQSPIPGRIEQWYVLEGDFVKKGDTILRISEIKSDYFDDKLTQRTGSQINAKSSSVTAYKNKINALKDQINSLKEELVLKSKQAQNKLLQSSLKVKTDSIDLAALKIKSAIAEKQYQRTINLQKEGLKAIKDVEDKKAKLQEVKAKYISQQNKLLTSKNNVINAQLNITTLTATYGEKLAKAKSSLYTAQSSALETEIQVSKLETSFANYKKRNSLLFITAPQNGIINKVLKAGLGETFKEGDKIVGIMPVDYDLAVEMYVEPIDLPLINLGEEVRVQFDGWPAIVFNGWPNLSYGTYNSKIVVIDNYVGENGKCRVLIAPVKDDEAWPSALRVGSGAQTIALLNDVPIWYELWRKINSFPPDFYNPKNSDKNKKKKN